MLMNLREQSNKLKELNISISYSGPMWEDGIKGLAEMVKTSLSHEDLPNKISKAIFSVFVEQVTNMLMYSTGKEKNLGESCADAPTGMLLLGHKNKTFFIFTGNEIKAESSGLIKKRIDHLNSLDKIGLRQYYKDIMRNGDDNPESKGAGLGLIEIARRASSPIKYLFEEVNDKVSYFTMYVEIGQEESE